MTDKLKHIKEFFVANALDGFGSRRYIGFHDLESARKYIHNYAVPGLYAAIKSDDPDYDPQGAPTEAATNAATIAFTRHIGRDMEALERIDKYGDLYLMMCTPGQTGCFMDELHDALTADDPDWRTRG
ncbi:hypothetical protein [Nocardia terpenica]|uniref:Uncharacterized protein n=1 Tax=Nocardia terpenica TaxID=455432 RepID=A0A164LAI5_9NOCA|nr:hypothetical protein [Nocardia terpenica]KZM72192.1 hypothetical protein AWN90_36560 [Nocardia terpenica]NQE86664.1 hypothetical protein [Nocardia terpenica]